MTPFERGVRAGLEAAARVAEGVADDLLHRAIAAEDRRLVSQYGARAIGVGRALAAIRSLDPTTIKEDADGRE